MPDDESGSMLTASESERIRLVEIDLSQANEFIKGTLATGAAIRASAATAWLALIGFSIQQHLWQLSLMAAFVTGVFWVIDGFYGWLYDQAAKHARRIEDLLSEYYSTLSKHKDNPRFLIKFRGSLRAYKYGLFRNFENGLKFRNPWHSRPRMIYQGLYPCIIILALLAGVLVFLSGAKGQGVTKVEIISRPAPTAHVTSKSLNPGANPKPSTINRGRPVQPEPTVRPS